MKKLFTSVAIVMALAGSTALSAPRAYINTYVYTVAFGGHGYGISIYTQSIHETFEECKSTLLDDFFRDSTDPIDYQYDNKRNIFSIETVGNHGAYTWKCSPQVIYLDEYEIKEEDI